MSLTEKKEKVFRFPKKACGHSMCSTMVGGSWRLAVGGWQLATGGWWRLVGVGSGWWLAVGGWRRLAVVGSWRWVAAGGWRRLVVGGWWRLVVGGWWRLACDGSWRLAVGGPLGLSLRAVLSKKKKSRPLRTPLLATCPNIAGQAKGSGLRKRLGGWSGHPASCLHRDTAWGRLWYAAPTIVKAYGPVILRRNVHDFEADVTRRHFFPSHCCNAYGSGTQAPACVQVTWAVWVEDWLEELGMGTGTERLSRASESGHDVGQELVGEGCVCHQG